MLNWKLTKVLPALFLITMVMPIPISQAQTDPVSTPVPKPTSALPGESAYDYYMRLGYAASKQGDPATALTYFRNALYVRPGDRLATIAYWNMANLMESGPTAEVATASSEPGTAYDRYMEIGYNATENRNYQTALINFQRALQARPGDTYALQAIRNVETYIERGVQARDPQIQLRRTVEGEDIGRPASN